MGSWLLIQRASIRARFFCLGSGKTPNSRWPLGSLGRYRRIAALSQFRVGRLLYWGRTRRAPERPLIPGARFALKRRRSSFFMQRPMDRRRGRGSRFGKTPKRVIRVGWEINREDRNCKERREVKSARRADFWKAGSRRAARRARERLVSKANKEVGFGSFLRRRDSLVPSAHPRARRE